MSDMPWFERAIRDHEAEHGPSGGAWNISMILQRLWAAATIPSPTIRGTAMTVSPSPEQLSELARRLRKYGHVVAADALESTQAEIARLTTALEAIRDYAPVESKDGTGPYTQIAVFARNTARAALKDSPNVG
jgi:hypothetical protein